MQKIIQRKMKLDIWLAKANGGGNITLDLIYEGKTLDEIANQIDRDQEEIFYYMNTGDTKKQQCFCFQGMMIRKAGIQAIRLSEADF